jgi:hypothetical protein
VQDGTGVPAGRRRRRRKRRMVRTTTPEQRVVLVLLPVRLLELAAVLRWRICVLGAAGSRGQSVIN